jgi:hypothetical protein
MRLDQTRNQWNRSIAMLRRAWIDFTNGIAQLITKELDKFRKEEIKAQLRAHDQREQSREAAQQ